MMTEETVPLTPLNNHDNEEEASNTTQQPQPLTNKCSKNQESGSVIKKARTLEKTDKLKSWVWKWCDPVLLDNGKTGAECIVKNIKFSTYY